MGIKRGVNDKCRRQRDVSKFLFWPSSSGEKILQCLTSSWSASGPWILVKFIAFYFSLFSQRNYYLLTGTDSAGVWMEILRKAKDTKTTHHPYLQPSLRKRREFTGRTTSNAERTEPATPRWRRPTGITTRGHR